MEERRRQVKIEKKRENKKKVKSGWSRWLMENIGNGQGKGKLI